MLWNIEAQPAHPSMACTRLLCPAQVVQSIAGATSGMEGRLQALLAKPTVVTGGGRWGGWRASLCDASPPLGLWVLLKASFDLSTPLRRHVHPDLALAGQCGGGRHPGVPHAAGTTGVQSAAPLVRRPQATCRAAECRRCCAARPIVSSCAAPACQAHHLHPGSRSRTLAAAAAGPNACCHGSGCSAAAGPSASQRRCGVGRVLGGSLDLAGLCGPCLHMLLSPLAPLALCPSIRQGQAQWRAQGAPASPDRRRCCHSGRAGGAAAGQRQAQAAGGGRGAAAGAAPYAAARSAAAAGSQQAGLPCRDPFRLAVQ